MTLKRNYPVSVSKLGNAFYTHNFFFELRNLTAVYTNKNIFKAGEKKKKLNLPFKALHSIITRGLLGIFQPVFENLNWTTPP